MAGLANERARCRGKNASYITMNFLFPSNLNVSRDEVEGNIEIEILGKQNSLFSSGPVIDQPLQYNFLFLKFFGLVTIYFDPT